MIPEDFIKVAFNLEILMNIISDLKVEMIPIRKRLKLESDD